MPDRKRLSVEQQQAWRSFIETEHRLERHLSQHLQREFGLSAADFEVLVNLSEAPGTGCGCSRWVRPPSGRKAGSPIT